MYNVLWHAASRQSESASQLASGVFAIFCTFSRPADEEVHSAEGHQSSVVPALGSHATCHCTPQAVVASVAPHCFLPLWQRLAWLCLQVPLAPACVGRAIPSDYRGLFDLCSGPPRHATIAGAVFCMAVTCSVTAA